MTAFFTTGMEVVALLLSISCLVGIAIVAYVHPSAWQVKNYRFMILAAMAGNLSFTLLVLADIVNWERGYFSPATLATISLFLLTEIAGLTRYVSEAFQVRSAVNGYQLRKVFDKNGVPNGRWAAATTNGR